MPPLSIVNEESGFLFLLENALAQVEAADDGRFHLALISGNNQIHATLSPVALQTLGLQCVALMPDLTPRYTVANIEDAYRQPALTLKLHSDRTIQLLLREVQAETLVDFLWYMKDRELIMKVVNNMSTRAGEALVQDLNDTWYGKNPDTALESHARRGRQAVVAIMDILQRLINEGQIPDILGAASQANNNKPHILSSDEVDALLNGEPETKNEP